MNKKPVFVFDERSLEKISDIKDQGFMDITKTLELARANNDVYQVAYRQGRDESAAIISRLCGAIEDYLDGETQGNVTGLRQAVAAAERNKK